MSNDPQAKWRKPGTEPAAPPVAPKASVASGTEYRAFSLIEEGVGDFITFRRASGIRRRLNYNWLVDIIDDDEKGTYIVLYFHFGVKVSISGRNLQHLMLGLAFRRAETVTELTDAHNPPANGEPVVYSIEIETRELDAVPKKELAKKAGREEPVSSQ